MTDMGIGDPIRDDLKVKLPSARAWNTLTFPSADTERACMHQSFFTRPPSTTTSIRPDTHPTKASAQVKNCSAQPRSEEHTSELQSLMRISYAVFCLKKKKQHTNQPNDRPNHNKNKHCTNTA